MRFLKFFLMLVTLIYISLISATAFANDPDLNTQTRFTRDVFVVQATYKSNTPANSQSIEPDPVPESGTQIYISDTAFVVDDGHVWLYGCSKGQINSSTGQCLDSTAFRSEILMFLHPLESSEQQPEPQNTVQQSVSNAIAQLTLPKPDIIIGPDPANNEWNALAIGLPIWLRNSNIESLTTSVNQDGIEINITATPVQHVFNMGNGDQVACTTMAVNPGRFDGYIPPKSPDCGYTYLDETGDYTITSTTTYNINWTASGQTGTATATTTSTKQLEIIELHTVVVG